jgi:hypothetical protein
MTAKSNTPKHVVTVVTIFSDGTAEVSTTNRKWANRLAKLEQKGYAQEVESATMGRHFVLEANMFRPPFHRENTREWTDEEREAARVRFAANKAKKAAANKHNNNHPKVIELGVGERLPKGVRPQLPKK